MGAQDCELCTSDVFAGDDDMKNNLIQKHSRNINKDQEDFLTLLIGMEPIVPTSINLINKKRREEISELRRRRLDEEQKN